MFIARLVIHFMRGGMVSKMMMIVMLIIVSKMMTDRVSGRVSDGGNGVCVSFIFFLFRCKSKCAMVHKFSKLLA